MEQSSIESNEPTEPREYTPYEVRWLELREFIFRIDDLGALDPASYDGIREDMDAGEITEAIRYFALSVRGSNLSDEEIELLVTEFEAICQRMQKLTAFVYYGEAAENLRKNLRG